MTEAQKGAGGPQDPLGCHLGSVYSCLTELRFGSSADGDTSSSNSSCSSSGNSSSSSSSRNSSSPVNLSARCLIPETTASLHRCTHGHYGVAAPSANGGASASSDVAIREVFCRALPRRTEQGDGGSTRCDTDTMSSPKYPAARGVAAATSNADVRALRKALARMYEGLQAVHSQRPLDADAEATPVDSGSEGDRQPVSRDQVDAAQLDLLGSPLTTCSRLHAGLVPLYQPLVESDDCVFLLFACLPFRLTAFTQLCRGLRGTAGLSPLLSAAGGRRARSSVDLAVRFVFYQLLRVVDYLHSRGIAVGNLSSSNILLTDHLWVQIAPSMPLLLGGAGRSGAPVRSPRSPPSGAPSPAPLRSPSEVSAEAAAAVLSSPVADRLEILKETRRRQRRHVARRQRRHGSPRRSPGDDLPLTYRWVKGMVTNLEYLIAVNAAAGRLLGDRSCHPVVPWVTDFSRKLGEVGSGGEPQEKGWRDLTITKFRLKKGDAQLDKSYSEGKPPHHVPESLSELTLVVYLARRLPLQVLKNVVRSELVAEEYPPSVARMYSWTPDECVPELYTDPGVFRSTHGDAGGLPNLKVPPWCNGSPEEFVRYHRSLLEGEYVSRNLHRWLDLTFGYCLKGQAAVDNKNVPLTRGGAGLDAAERSAEGSAGGGLSLLGKDLPGFVQLFRHPHPPRKLATVGDTSAPPEARPPSTGSDPPLKAPTLTHAGDERGFSRSLDGGDASARDGRSDNGTGTRNGGAAKTAETSGAEASGKGGGASIFGVAFDDYIGEDGVCPPSSAADALPPVVGPRLERRGESDGSGVVEARARIEEDRRALAFAYDVELRLEPWYGRQRGNRIVTGGGRLDVGEAGSAPGSGASKAADLLACGCVLSEMCAGEPVLAGPSYSARTSDRGGGAAAGRTGWLEAAGDLPPALRGAIGALTHPDPNQRPSALALLSTTDSAQKGGTSSRRRGSWAGRLGAAPLPSYRGLFPPYMRDVYAFLAALHQEETARKRIILAAAALPVLQVPLHAFSLVVPHLVPLLEGLPFADPTRSRAGADTGRRGKIDSASEERDRARAALRRRSQEECGPYRKLTVSGVLSTATTVPSMACPESESVVTGSITNDSVADLDTAALEGESAKHLHAWVAVVDMCTARLGPSLASEVLLPVVLRTLESVQSPEYACRLMEAELWGVLARRFGNGPFLRHAFPLLLAWLDLGVNGDISGGGKGNAGDFLGAAGATQATVSSVNENSGQLRGIFGGRGDGDVMATTASDEDAAARVQVAAAASISKEVYESLGPALAARYLVPALVDCMGRLAVTAASAASALALSSVRIRPRPPPKNTTTTAEPPDSSNADGSTHVKLVEGSGRVGKEDPASRALLRYCHSRKGIGGDPDAGIGKGSTFLVLSRALGDICSRIDSEEVTVPLVLSRLFYQIFPSLEPVLMQRGGACASATGFRSVLETTSLLGRLLPMLCPEMISHFYAGLRPASSSSAPPSKKSTSVSPRTRGGVGRKGPAVASPATPGQGGDFVGAPDFFVRGSLSPGSSHGGGGFSIAATNAVPDEATSVPWLLSTMPLPQPLGGLDLPWSADGAPVIGDERGEAGPHCSAEDKEEDEYSSWQAASDGVASDGESQAENTVMVEQQRAFSGHSPDKGGLPLAQRSGIDSSHGGTSLGGIGDVGTADASARSSDLAFATSPHPVPSVTDEPSPVAVSSDRPRAGTSTPPRQKDACSAPSGEDAGAAAEQHKIQTGANVSLQFVCHVETARLLAATATGVLNGDGGGGEACGRLLQAGEDFFAAFGRSYGGLVFSSPTMVAALRLAREIHSPLTSLFGCDIMRERIPSASRRMEAWLRKDTDVTVDNRRPPHPAAPREGFGGFDDIRKGSAQGIVTTEAATRSFRSVSDSGGNRVRARSVGPSSGGREKSPVGYEVGDSSLETTREAKEHARVPSASRRPSDCGMYISPGLSPVGSIADEIDHSSEPVILSGPYPDESGTRPKTADPGKVNEVREIDDEGAAPAFLNRIQQAIRQRLAPEGAGGGAAVTTKRSPMLLISGRLEESPIRSNHRNTLQEPGSRTQIEQDPTKNSERAMEERVSTSRGVPAWGPLSKDEIDHVLPPPTSTLPPPPSPPLRSERDGGRVAQGQRGAEPGRAALGVLEPRDGRDRSFEKGGPHSAVEGEGADEDGELEDVASVLEWPSLLGAIGSKAPHPSGPTSFVQDSPKSTAASAACIPADAGSVSGDSSRGRAETAAAMVTATMEKLGLTNSPPRSPFLRALPTSRSPLTQSDSPHLLLRQAASFSSPPPLPGTCRGAGVEVPDRLRDRAWLAGTRAWGHFGRSSGQRRGRGLGEGFDRDAVGCLFPLGMVLQTSFLAYPDKVPVTSMAVPPRSESILLTGSGDGEVRVWSLTDHPVVRRSGFRSGDNGGGSGRKTPSISRPQRAAVTQLGMFEGAERAAALDGLVRVWDVERSQGLAICHQANSGNAAPLTAFALTGCGDGTIPPLDDSEWDDLAVGASGSSSYSAADDQQLAAVYDGGVVHYDCRQGRLGGAVQNLFPVAQWDAEARLESMRSRLPSKSQTDTQGSSRRGDTQALPLGLCCVCEGDGAWLAAGSGGGQVVVFDKRRAGGRPLFWWNAHAGPIVGVFYVARHLLLTVSRDRTAVLWDLSRSPAEMSGVDSTGPVRHHPTWGMGAYSEEAAFSSRSGLGEMPPVRVSTAFGLPDDAPGMAPSTVVMLPLARPPRAGEESRTSGGFSAFGEGYAYAGRGGGVGEGGEAVPKMPVLFASAGESMVASSVRREAGEEELYPATFSGPSGKKAGGRSGARRSASVGGLAVRSVAVLPLRRTLLLGCTDGWIRVGT